MPLPSIAVPAQTLPGSGVVVPVTLFNSLAIRDTNAHDPSTDATVLLADLRTLPGNRVFYYSSGLDQNVTAQLVASYDGQNLIAIGSTATISAGTRGFLDSSNFVLLTNPYPYLGVRLTGAGSPTVGGITLALLASSAMGVSNVGSISLGTTTITGAIPAGTNDIGRVHILDGPYATFAASLTDVGLGTTPTDFVGIYNNSTGTVRVTRLILGSLQTTAGTNNIYLTKRSALNTGGSSATVSAVPYDKNNVASNAVVRTWSVNPTGLGTSVGTLGEVKLFANTPTGGVTDRMVIDFGQHPAQQELALYQNEGLYLNFNGAAAPTGFVLSGTIEWTEN